MPNSAAKWIKTAVWIAIGGGLVAALAYSFLPKPIPAETAVIEVGPMTVTVDEDGMTRVIDRYLLSAPLHGMMSRIELSPGDPVTVGTRLATIEPIAAPLMDARSRAQAEAHLRATEAALRQSNAATERARIAHEFAKDELARTRPLVEAGNLPRRNLELAELELHSRSQESESAKFGARVARYELETAKAALGRVGAEEREGEEVEILSPIDGAVLRILNRNEGVVTAGTPLLELADPDRLEVVVDVLTSDAVRIERGDPVIIAGWGDERELAGAVRLVEPSAFTRVSALGVEEQRVNVIVEAVGPGWDETGLRDGFRVEVRIVTWGEPEVVKVPVSALFREGEDWAVFRVVDGRASLQRLQLGKRQGLAAQVLEGLAPGDEVIVHPSDEVVDGAELAVEG